MLTGIVIAKNEEENIKECLESISFCDELLVIDDCSVDKTVLCAKNAGAKVYKRKMEMGYADQRNFALNKASNDWVLFVDADERVSESLKNEIIRVVNGNDKISGFYVKRQDVFFGRKMKYGEFGNTKLLRLGKKTAGKWVRAVHEVWEINGKIEELENPLNHESRKDLHALLDKINIYTNLHAQSNYDEGKRSNRLKIIYFPLLKFISNYFLKLGFLDGAQGMVTTLLMSFHSYLSWSKLWLYQKNPKSLKS